LEDYVRLRDGQKIPSVAQILDAFVASTNLKCIILDIKGNVGIFKYLEPIIRSAYAQAATLNRDVLIITDIPSDDVLTEYLTQPSYATLPIIYDISLQGCIDHGFKYWMPRFSEGLLLDDVDKAHGLGIKVYSWTLNDMTLVNNYLQNGRFDGLLSDYPAYIVYDYYTMF
jgi:glycerophosphoryl diester phosphodiesterase